MLAATMMNNSLVWIRDHLIVSFTAAMSLQLLGLASHAQQAAAVAISEVGRNWDYGKRYISNACRFVDNTIAKRLLVVDSKYSDVPLITKTAATRINSPMHIPFRIHAVAVPAKRPIIIRYC